MDCCGGKFPRNTSGGNKTNPFGKNVSGFEPKSSRTGAIIPSALLLPHRIGSVIN
jgi:hypothetical protein